VYEGASRRRIRAQASTFPAKRSTTKGLKQTDLAGARTRHGSTAKALDATPKVSHLRFDGATRARRATPRHDIVVAMGLSSAARASKVARGAAGGGRRERSSMQEIIQRVAAAAGLEEGVAGRAVGLILGFLQREGPPDAVGQLIGALPGAEQLIADSSGGGGGLMGMIGGGMGGIMGLGSQLMGAGLSMGQMQTVGRELFSAAREQAGDEALGQIVSSIPGLSQFV